MTREEAIRHFEYGISHDIFKEPVTSYAKLAVAALREQEELAVLPCKPGDMVYRIVWWGKRNVDIRERRVSSVEYNAAGEWVIHSTGSDVLGKTVFLTREEAEKALKEDA